MKTNRILLIVAVLLVGAFAAHAILIRDTVAGGYMLGRASDKLGFHGATPTIQRVGAAQAAVVALTGTLTGTANGALVDVAATAAATAGAATPSAAQVDAGIATAVASIVTGTNEQLKELQTENAAQAVLINELRAALVAKGIIKGAP